MLACPRCRATYPDNLGECPVDGSTLLPSEMLPAVDAGIEPGTMIGEYRVDRKLGSGTFGEVYAGEQPLIGKQVAIKLLHRKYSSDAEVVSRFVAEARAVNRIRHRHIIDIFSFGLLSENRHYFVMELLDGLTLGQLLERERRLPLEVALPIFRGIAGALDAAHEAGITHRDLKPDNIFLALEKDGGYFSKLLDFGIAKLVDDEVAHKTATGIAIGTPRYMSPEQCRGKKVDYKADIYSLGVVIHEVLTGQPLFDGDSAMDVLFKHTSEPPPSMSSVNPELPPELDEPVLAMLAKRPKQRPESAGAAVAALMERARASGQAALLPVSSKHSASSARVVISSADGSAASSDVATVAVRQRNPTASSAGQPETSTVAMAPAISAAEATERSASPQRAAAHPTTEIAPASAVSGTLLRDVKDLPIGEAPISETSPERPDTSTLRSARPAAAVTVAPVTAGGSRAEPTRPRGMAVWGIVAVGALAVVGVVALVSRRTPERNTVTAPLDATSTGAGSASASVRAAQPPELVKVRLSVTPPEAAVWFDDRRVGSARDALMLPRSSESHVMRVEHEGYEPVTLWVVPDRDVELAPITLTRAVPIASAGSGTAASGTGAASGKPLAKPIVPRAIEPNPFQR